MEKTSGKIINVKRDTTKKIDEQKKEYIKKGYVYLGYWGGNNPILKFIVP